MIITDVAELGILVQRTRKTLGLTQAELAMAAQVGVRFIVDLEAGKQTVQLYKVIKVCRMLGLSVDVK